MTRQRLSLGVALAALCSLLLPTLATAQSDDVYTRWGGMRDRFHIDAGAFFVGHDTFALLRPSGSDIPGVDIERQTDIPADTSDFRMEGYLRLGKRHRLVLGYMQMNRDAAGATTPLLRHVGGDPQRRQAAHAGCGAEARYAHEPAVA